MCRTPDRFVDAQRPPADPFRLGSNPLQNREPLDRLLRALSSLRRRFGPAPDELLIFFAIGHLGRAAANEAIKVIPIGSGGVSVLLGSPR